MDLKNAMPSDVNGCLERISNSVEMRNKLSLRILDGPNMNIDFIKLLDNFSKSLAKENLMLDTLTIGKSIKNKVVET